MASGTSISTTLGSSDRPSRHAGLDWLRVFATLGVLTLHAGIAYMPHPLPGLRWAAHDTPTAWADAICWPLDAWVMPVFFLLGGMAAATLLDRLGPGDMARHRVRRLGGPLLLGCVLILPLDLYVWLLGAAADGSLPLRKLQSLKLKGYDDGLWGPSHLWFLQYLLLYCLAAAAIRARRPLPLRIDPLRERRTMAAAIAASIAALAIEPRILIGFRHHPLPQWENAVFFAAFFLVGLRRPAAAWSRGKAVAWLTLGGLSLAAAWPMMVGQWATLASGDSTPLAIRVPLAACFGLACWGLGLGSLEMARTIRRPLPPSLRRVAAAAFCIYLLHHPVVGLAQVGLKPMAMPSAAKFALVAAIGLAIPMLSYPLVVRGRWIGRVLGEKPAPKPQPALRSAA